MSNPLDTKVISKLAEILDKSNLTELEYEDEGCRICLTRELPHPAPLPPVHPAPVPPAFAPAPVMPQPAAPAASTAAIIRAIPVLRIVDVLFFIFSSR